jgi:hypothetical protein
MRTRFIVIAAAVIVAIGLGVGLGVGLGSSGAASATGPGTGVSQATQLASLQTGCQQWLDSAPAEPGTAQWCTDMTQWMSAYMVRSGMGPQMMWGDPGSLTASCERWISATPPPGAPADATSWCDSMAAWMNAHIGSWGGGGDWSDWMGHGPMMGLPAPATAPPATSPVR